MNRSQAESDSSGEIRAAATIKRGIPSRASESQSDGGWAMRLARWSYFRPSARAMITPRRDVVIFFPGWG